LFIGELWQTIQPNPLTLQLFNPSAFQPFNSSTLQSFNLTPVVLSLQKILQMPVNKEVYTELVNELKQKKVTLVAVSKTKSVEDIHALYELGHKDFGENYVQELLEKQTHLPADIRWHFIGHLQSNKVKHIAPFVHLIHSVDSFKLLSEINKQGQKINRIINCLLQVHIAQEETKFGFDERELDETINQLANPEGSGQVMQMKNIKVVGLMGMASFTDDMNKVRTEFKYLKALFNKCRQLQTTNLLTGQVGYKLQTLSMGMSSDYTIAIEEGSNMIRVGSLLFGART
jgi:PLP dependent protein